MNVLFKIYINTKRIISSNRLLMFISFFVFVLLYYLLLYKKYFLTEEFMYDLETYNQIVWRIVHGLSPFSTVFGKLNSDSHFEPILYLVAIPYALFQRPLFLLLIQLFFTGIAGIGLYLISLTLFNSKASALLVQNIFYYHRLTLAYLMDAFHPEVIAVCFFILSYYFYLNKRKALFLVTVLLALFCKESVVFLIFPYGIYLYFKDRRNPLGRWALLCSVFSIFYFLLAMKIITKMSILETNTFFNADSEVNAYGWLGSSPYEVMRNIISKLKLLIGKDLASKYLTYGIRVLDSFLYLPVFNTFILVALPTFLINTLSSRPIMQTMDFHYQTLLVPILFLSILLFFAKISKSDQSRKQSNVFFLYLFLVFFVNFIFFAKAFRYYVNSNGISPLEMKQIDKIIGNNSKILTTPKLSYFFSGRRYIYYKKPEDHLIDYIIVSKTDSLDTDNLSLVYQGDKLLLYKNYSINFDD